MNNLLVIIPAHNEELNIKNVIAEVKKDLPFADMVIINDYSSDNTEKILIEETVKFISLPVNLGYAGAVQTGFKYAVINGYDFVLQFDGDGQHIASEGGRLFEAALNTGADIVIGSRFVKNTGYQHSFFRKIGTILFSSIIKTVCKTNITDPTSGLQVLNRKTFTKYSKINNYPEYPDANLIIEMLLSGYKIIEVDVSMRQREFGVSMHTGVLKPIKYMINMIYAIFLLFLQRGEIKKGLK